MTGSATKTDSSLSLGIDVGTGSARAGVFTEGGQMLGSASHPIQLWRDGEHAEQSTADVWAAVSAAVRGALAEAGASGADVAGVGVDATCSLVAVGEGGRPVTVSASGDDARDVVVWMDHRAVDDARAINGGGWDVLRYVGGRISPEMQPPKLRWLRRELPDTWRRANRWFDLSDWLVWRATGADGRSLCTTVCKWTYQGHDAPDGGTEGWDDVFWRGIGLGDLVDEGYRRIGTRVRPMGEPAGDGLTAQAASELGLAPGTPVGVGIIDAHAGGLGTLASGLSDLSADGLGRAVALVGGTSSCHMAVAPEPRFVPGVWGPYYSAMVPGLWLAEGGQSATGALVDHVVFSHARADALRQQAEHDGTTVYDLLNDRLARLAGAESVTDPAVSRLAAGLHVLPDHHGNRSPRADPTLRGMVSGLALDDSLDALALLYLATVQAVAHGTRHVLDALEAEGYAFESVVACGGGTKNPLFLQAHADATARPVVLPAEPEAVLLGSAMLGAVAAGRYRTVQNAMGAMSGVGSVVRPHAEVAGYHAAKHAVFLRIHDDQLAYRALMDGAPAALPGEPTPAEAAATDAAPLA